MNYEAADQLTLTQPKNLGHDNNLATLFSIFLWSKIKMRSLKLNDGRSTKKKFQFHFQSINLAIKRFIHILKSPTVLLSSI